jgi:hypothetical protein
MFDQYEHFIRRFQCKSKDRRHFETDNWDESLNETGSDNVARVMNFAMAKNLNCRGYSVPTLQYSEIHFDFFRREEELDNTKPWIEIIFVFFSS